MEPDANISLNLWGHVWWLVRYPSIMLIALCNLSSFLFCFFVFVFVYSEKNHSSSLSWPFMDDLVGMNSIIDNMVACYLYQCGKWMKIKIEKVLLVEVLIKKKKKKKNSCYQCRIRIWISWAKDNNVVCLEFFTESGIDWSLSVFQFMLQTL